MVTIRSNYGELTSKNNDSVYVDIIGVAVTEADVLTDERETPGSLGLLCFQGLEPMLWVSVKQGRSKGSGDGMNSENSLVICTTYAIAHPEHPFGPCN